MTPGIESITPDALWEWLLCLCIVMIMVRQGMLLYREARSPEPTPPYYRQFADRVETDERIKDLKRQINDVRQENKKQCERLLEAGEQRAKDLHDRINEIPAQVIQTLRDTKGLL
jgi:flagellar biosynthesis/type III secretory pathway M-ring protein FliF/YscJ